MIRKLARLLLPSDVLEAAAFWRAQRRRKRLISSQHRRFGRAAMQSLPFRNVHDHFPLAPGSTLVLPASSIQGRDLWQLPVLERCVLAGIIRSLRPSRVFEFGTYLGDSTLLIAMNAPSDAVVTTLELNPAEREHYYRSAGLNSGWDFDAGVRYRDTPYADRVQQKFGNSSTFDFGPYRGEIGLVYVDGDHTYEQVRRDTLAALEMINAGGVIVWDDYTPECVGVVRCLNELAQRAPIYRLSGTRFVFYRHPGPSLP